MTIEGEVFVKTIGPLTIYQNTAGSFWVVRDERGRWLGGWQQSGSQIGKIRRGGGSFNGRTYRTYRGWETAIRRYV